MSFTISATKSSLFMSSTKSNLTPEQLQRMEENRLKALAKKLANSKANSNTTGENVDPVNKIHTIHTIDQQPKTSIFNNPSKINTIQNKNTSKPTSSVVKQTMLQSQGTSSSPTKSASQSDSAITGTHGKCIPLEEDPENRFEIIIGYNKALVDLFKTLKGRKYEPNNKRWNFPRKNYNDIILQIKHQLNDTVKLDPIIQSSKKMVFLKFFLINKTRFEAVSDYKPELNEIYKTMKTSAYDTAGKKWNFELGEYDLLVSAILAKLKSDVSIVPLPKIVKEFFKDKLSGVLKLENTNGPVINKDHLTAFVDKTITKSLLPFQVESICFAIKQEGRLLLADDMGLGKTIQGLAIASYYRDEWPLFIVCPSSVKYMWKENTKRWMSNSIREVCHIDDDDDVDQFIQVIENGRDKVEKKSKVVISSYDLVARNVDELATANYKMVIADECHLLKNSQAKRTKSVLKLLQNAKRVLLMSGTPALSRPMELFSQISAICPSVFNNPHDFGMRYCDGKETNFGYDYSGYSNMAELRTVLEEKLLIRREKKDVMSQLPSKTRETVVLNSALVELNSKTLKQASKVHQSSKQKGKESHGALLNYFQETSRVKAKAVAEYVLDLLESEKKFLVFAHHQNMLDSLEAELVEKNYDFIRIDGSTSSERRNEMVNKFQNDKKCLCALLSITAANSGITLTAANLVCFAELYWNPGILVQAEDRVYRIGQQNAVNIQYLCARGTCDDDMWMMVKDKLEVLGKVGLTKESMDGTKESVVQSSEEDIAKLKAFNEQLGQKNKITKYIEGKESSVTVVTKGEARKGENKFDDLLDGVDFGDAVVIEEKEPVKEVKQIKMVKNIIKKSSPPNKYSDDKDDDDLLNEVDLDVFSPKKKQKSIFKKKS